MIAYCRRQNVVLRVLLIVQALSQNESRRSLHDVTHTNAQLIERLKWQHTASKSRAFAVVLSHAFRLRDMRQKAHAFLQLRRAAAAASTQVWHELCFCVLNLIGVYHMFPVCVQVRVCMLQGLTCRVRAKSRRSHHQHATPVAAPV